MSTTQGTLRQLPNALSSLRILATPVLAYCAFSGAERAFTAILIAALLTDIADGFLARRMGLTSALGALLDSIADLLLFVAAVLGIWCFHPMLLHAHRIAAALLIGLWMLEPLVAFWRYGRVSSFHTYASKAAGYLLGITLGVLFIWGLPTPLLYAAVGVGILASVEELALIGLLPTWRSNVRGVYWVLRDAARAVR